MNTLEQIVSPALIQKSRQSNIAALLSLPLIIYAGLGVLVILANGNFYVASYFANFSWMGWGYVSVASLFLGAGILGELQGLLHGSMATKMCNTARIFVLLPHVTLRVSCRHIHRLGDD
jgi:hypothetical protein